MVVPHYTLHIVYENHVVYLDWYNYVYYAYSMRGTYPSRDSIIIFYETEDKVQLVENQVKKVLIPATSALRVPSGSSGIPMPPGSSENLPRYPLCLDDVQDI